MFSDRTAWITDPSPLSVAIAERRARATPLLDLTVSNPTRVGAPPSPDALRAALADPAVAVYDPDPAGPHAARAAVADYYASLGCAVDPACVRLAASTSEAYGWLFKLLCDPGDSIIVAHPSYPLLDDLARLEGVTLAAVASTWFGWWSSTSTPSTAPSRRAPARSPSSTPTTRRAPTSRASSATLSSRVAVGTNSRSSSTRSFLEYSIGKTPSGLRAS